MKISILNVFVWKGSRIVVPRLPHCNILDKIHKVTRVLKVSLMSKSDQFFGQE